jgi:hypothetical protein
MGECLALKKTLKEKNSIESNAAVPMENENFELGEGGVRGAIR